MKKIFYVSVLLIVIFMSTACGEKNSLSCYEKIGDSFKQTLFINYNEEKTKVDSASIEIVINTKDAELSLYKCGKETSAECIEELASKYNLGCDNMLDNCKVVDKTETTLKFTANIKKEKLEEYFNKISTTLPINQMKSKLEIKQGLTCE